MTPTNTPNVAQVRADILARFVAMKSTRNFALTMPWLKAYKAALDPTGLDNFDAACEQMVVEGLITHRPGRGPHVDTIAITKAGIGHIYPPADPDIIRHDVLAKFREIGAKEGYTLPEFWLQRDYERGINEIQQGILQGTLQDMASEGLVEYVAHPSPNLKITASGLEKIEQLGL